MGSLFTTQEPLSHLIINGDANGDANASMERDREKISSEGNKVGLWMLVGLTYFGVSGGPFGSEVAVQAAGPGLAILGFIVMPFVWSLPEALMTAELCTNFPEASGFCAWTNAAFGPCVSFICSFMSWLSGVTDNAVYPVMMFAYLEAGGMKSLSPVAEWALVVAITLVLTVLTWRGLDVTATTSVLLTTFILAPFVVLCVLTLPHAAPENWLRPPEHGLQGVDWRSLLNILFWNLNYFDSASAFSGDCVSPERTFPRGMLLTWAAIFFTYLLPLLAVTGVAPDERYCDGCYASLSKYAVGSWLSVWIQVAAFTSCIGQFIAEMASDSFQLMGMADRGQLPKFVGGRSRYGTPTFAVVVSAVCIVFLARLSFQTIVELVNILYALTVLAEFAAFIVLRRRQQSVLNGGGRVYRVPVNDQWGAVVMFIPASVFVFAVMAFSSSFALALAFVALVAGFLLYLWNCTARKRGWIDYAPVDSEW
eukprot:CAMPEP_0185793042 /NCGR_PEP_ID=MMETSP1174-20130828/159252_1 /TAXON_ID=35687 /ORGANISM="Dictyocha speculum, Strain CCMP1381" /LENGTH=479 /DNA_ID=CAMNT_0028488147 /DNA_START=162 /DNA_END=1598 /DNA_ORIENTATION=-